jgi:hypothetical protein
VDYENNLLWHHWNMAAKKRILMETKDEPPPKEAYYIKPNSDSDGTNISSLAASEATRVTEKSDYTPTTPVEDVKKYDKMNLFEGMNDALKEYKEVTPNVTPLFRNDEHNRHKNWEDHGSTDMSKVEHNPLESYQVEKLRKPKPYDCNMEPQKTYCEEMYEKEENQRRQTSNNDMGKEIDDRLKRVEEADVSKRDYWRNEMYYLMKRVKNKI